VVHRAFCGGRSGRRVSGLDKRHDETEFLSSPPQGARRF
jgi:hypothetical protein